VKRKAVFVDRDGTINEDVGYVYSPERLYIYRWAAPAIKMLKDAGFFVIVVTNQAGVSRGFLTEEMLQDIHAEMVRRLKRSGAMIDAIYYSVDPPFQPSDTRKPSPGMIKRAVEEFNIDLDSSYVVGDKVEDLLLARNAGCKGILVKTGYGKGMLNNFPKKVEDAAPVYIAEDLGDAAMWIASRKTKKQLLRDFVLSASKLSGILFSTADAYMDWEELDFLSSHRIRTVLEVGGALSINEMQRACDMGVWAVSLIYVDGVKNLDTFFNVVDGYPCFKRFVSLEDCPGKDALELLKRADGVIVSAEESLPCLDDVPVLRKIDRFLIDWDSKPSVVEEVKPLYDRLHEIYFSV